MSSTYAQRLLNEMQSTDSNQSTHTTQEICEIIIETNNVQTISNSRHILPMRVDNKAAERSRLYRERHREKINQRRRDIRQRQQNLHQIYAESNVQKTDEIERITEATSNNQLSSNSHTQRQQRYYERHKHEINKRKRDKRLKKNISRSVPTTAAERNRNYRERNKHEINERRRHSRLRQQIIKGTRSIQMPVTCATELPPSALPTPASLVTSPEKTPPRVNIRRVGAEFLQNDYLECTNDRTTVPAKKVKVASSNGNSQPNSSTEHQPTAAAAVQLAFEPHNAAAIQALQHQLLRGLSGAGGSGSLSPAAAAVAMMQYSPLLYTYQLAMAQASALVGGEDSSKSNSPQPTSSSVTMAEMQRLAECQCLLDMITRPVHAEPMDEGLK